MKTFYNYDAYAKWREQGDPTEFVKCVGEGALFWADAYNWRNRHKAEPENQYNLHPQPAGEAVPVEDGSLQARIGEIGNQVHNIACEHQDNEALADRLGDLRGELWEIAKEVAHPPQPSVSITEAAVDAAYKALPPDAHGTIGSGEMERVLEAAFCALKGGAA